MITIQKLFTQSLIAFALLISFTFNASASIDEPYTEARFKALQDAGEVVLLDIHATWCSTCAKQQVALDKYVANNPEKKLHILKIDFDTQKDIVKKFRAPRQSTFLLYKGKKQFWFSVAESRYDVIAAEINKAMNFGMKKR